MQFKGCCWSRLVQRRLDSAAEAIWETLQLRALWICTGSWRPRCLSGRLLHICRLLVRQQLPCTEGLRSLLRAAVGMHTCSLWQAAAHRCRHLHNMSAPAMPSAKHAL